MARTVATILSVHAVLCVSVATVANIYIGKPHFDATLCHSVVIVRFYASVASKFFLPQLGNIMPHFATVRCKVQE